MKTSASAISRYSAACPSLLTRSSASPRLLRLSSSRPYGCCDCGMPGSFGTCRKASPAPGGSILITSAPKSANNVAAAGAAMKLPQSITFKPSKILLIGSSIYCGLSRQHWLVWSPSTAILRPEDVVAAGTDEEDHERHDVARRDIPAQRPESGLFMSDRFRFVMPARAATRPVRCLAGAPSGGSVSCRTP